MNAELRGPKAPGREIDDCLVRLTPEKVLARADVGVLASVAREPRGRVIRPVRLQPGPYRMLVEKFLGAADDAMVTKEFTRIAYVRVLDAHRRAIATHEAAAALLKRAGDGDAAPQERAHAEIERERLATAELRHPEWAQTPSR